MQVLLNRLHGNNYINNSSNNTNLQLQLSLQMIDRLEHQHWKMLMLFYFTILKTTLSFIPYYFTIPPHPKLLFVLKYYFFKLSLLFLSTVNFFSDFGVIPSFQRSHFFPNANFFPGLSKFQQPIFFNSHLNSHE